VALYTRPEVVIETGVAHGVTSRIVLEALEQNDLGHLWSIDLPFPFDHWLHGETGLVVADECRSRWTYLEGSSKQRLPSLVSEVGHAEMFIHDSLHTAENTLFEIEQAGSAMPTGGVRLVDDTDSYTGLRHSPSGILNSRPSSVRRQTGTGCSASRSKPPVRTASGRRDGRR
jgi:Methyltransferase domain